MHFEEATCLYQQPTRFRLQEMAVSISEICENTKLAREMALTGNYDTSGVYYQGVVQQIHKLLSSLVDANKKAKWQQVQYQIVQEFEKVKATSSTLQLFKAGEHSERIIGLLTLLSQSSLIFLKILPSFTLIFY